MQNAGNVLCPFCGGKIPPLARLCKHCLRKLHSMKLARPRDQRGLDIYEIVPDGKQFSIVFRGEVKVPGLAIENLAEAQSVVAMLNRFIENETAG